MSPQGPRSLTACLFSQTEAPSWTHLHRVGLDKHPLGVPEAPFQLGHVGAGRMPLRQNTDDLEREER